MQDYAARQSTSPRRSGRARSRLGAVLLLATAILVVPAPAGAACTCEQLPLGDPLELAGAHDPFLDTGFIGEVTEVRSETRAEPDPDAGVGDGTYVPYVVRVRVPLEGPVDDDEVLVLQTSRPPPGEINPDCAYGFRVPGRYLIEAHRNPDGTYLTNACSLTQPYGSPLAAEDAPDAATEADTRDGPAAWIGIALGAAAILVGAVLAYAFRRRRPSPVTAGVPAEPTEQTGPPTEPSEPLTEPPPPTEPAPDPEPPGEPEPRPTPTALTPPEPETEPGDDTPDRERDRDGDGRNEGPRPT